MPPLRSILAALALACFAHPANVARADPPFGPCPENRMSFGGAIFFTSTAASLDTTDFLGHIAYDLVAGTLVMQQCCSLGGVHLDAFDDYDVAGVPAGTPVSFTVQLAVDGAVWTAGCGGSGCSGRYVVDLIHGTEVDEVIHSDHLFSGRTQHHDVLSLPLTIVAGQPERLEYKLSGARNPGGSHGSEAFGRISFAGLPAGVSVVSCQGYAGAPTPVRRSSWGRLKTLYR